MLFQCLLYFTYMAFQGLLCGIFVHLESHHIASKSFEIFHTSPKNWLLMYYLTYEQECFIRYKTRGTAERIISDKARIACIFNKTIHFIPILSVCLWKNFQYRCCIRWENRSKSFVIIHMWFIRYKTTATVMISFVFCSWIINECFEKKLSLTHSWYTWEQSIKFTSVSSILSISFLCLNFAILKILTNCLETFHKWPNPELQKSCGHAGITREEGLPYVRSMRKV